MSVVKKGKASTNQRWGVPPFLSVRALGGLAPTLTSGLCSSDQHMITNCNEVGVAAVCADRDGVPVILVSLDRARNGYPGGLECQLKDADSHRAALGFYESVHEFDHFNFPDDLPGGIELLTAGLVSRNTEGYGWRVGVHISFQNGVVLNCYTTQ